MSVISLVSENDGVLRSSTERFDFSNPQMDPEQLSLDLIESMNAYGGYGLSANQIGYPYSVFVMKGDGINYVCFNPRIVWESDEKVLLEEGCLSFSDLFIKIKRSKHIRFRFQTPSGQTETRQFTGITARVVLHEVDHLNGIVFTERATRYHREMAEKHRRKFQRG